MPTRFRPLQNSLEAFNILQRNERAQITSHLSLVLSPDQEVDEMPFFMHLQIDCAFKCPKIFEPIQLGGKASWSETRALEVQEAQRRLILQLFPPQTPVPDSYNGSTDIPFLFSIAELPFGNTSALPSEFQTDLGTLLTLYPDDPTVGSPFGTGNETFGLSSQFKRASALLGDVSFQAPRRAWIQAAASAGVTTYGYLFADQNAATEASLGGAYSRRALFITHGD